MAENKPTNPAVILGIAAAAFFCLMVLSAGLKIYFGRKAAEDEAKSQVDTKWSESPAPAPSPPTDIATARTTLLGTGKAIQVAEADINAVAPPAFATPFPIESDTPPEYTITFDIKVANSMPGENAEFIILDRGGAGDDSNGRRPKVSLLSKWNHARRCTTAGAIMGACVTEDYVKTKDLNTIQFVHKSAAGSALAIGTTVGPQAGQDYKNLTIVVRSTGQTAAAAKLYWDGLEAGSVDSNPADWGLAASTWRWAGGQTAVNANIGTVMVKNAYVFSRALDDSEVATLLGRAPSATSTYVAEPAQTAWKFNPEGYSSD
jgi:hypothetical protein